MDDEKRNRFESIFQLYDLSNKQFNERRNYEFKVSIGFWTVLVAAIAGSISLAELTSVPNGNCWLLVVAIIITFLHVLWIFGLYIVAHRDRLRGISYETKLKKIADVGDFDKETEDYIQRVNESRLIKIWAVFFNVSVTALLALVLVLVNWNRLEGNGGSSVRELEKTKIELENRRIGFENQKLELEIEQLSKGIESSPQVEQPKKPARVQGRRKTRAETQNE